MLLRSVFVRFYKSFNYDYLRKYDPSVTEKLPWEHFEGMWYPYVCVTIDRHITAIVGENESGKSCLLSAIQNGISGHALQPKDFCRHSRFFTVEEGKDRYPQFGFEWIDLSDEERTHLVNACGIDEAPAFSRFFLFRTGPSEMDVYVPDGNELRPHKLPPEAVRSISDFLPTVFQLHANMALPESVPIGYLANDRNTASEYSVLRSRTNASFVDQFTENRSWFANANAINTNAASIVELVAALGRATNGGSSTPPAALQLAHDLIRKIARVDAGALRNLQDALTSGDDAYADSIVKDVNARLDAALNFPRVWAQDKNFRLNVSLRDTDLAFTIHDRTGTQYAFDERSSGLRYFLSYYVQYLAHTPARPDQPEILVMDEPDAYLSNQGQQDLLKIFQTFAFPDREGRLPVQVVYVTHSPFLIDRNHADRIRVFEKGAGAEGTRVVRDISRNHYEPLRSAFGAFVAETTFIGNCNLMVEGTSDQILLAGAARHLRSRADVPELETLDLNQITIVPTGGADQVPYLVFVALGRDVERPAVIVLLDSDAQGNRAKAAVLRGVGLHKKRRRRLLAEEHILQIGDVKNDAVSMEDLVPLGLAVSATHRYLEDYCRSESDLLGQVTAEAIANRHREQHGDRPLRVLEAVQEYIASLDAELVLQKVGFARAVIDTVFRRPDTETVGEFEENMRALLRQLNSMRRRAVRRRATQQISRRFERAKKTFLQDHPDSATREEAFVFFETIEDFLDESLEADAIRAKLLQMRRRHRIDSELAKPIADYATFREDLNRVQYAGLQAVQEGAATGRDTVDDTVPLS